jgi:hypothetical protein
MPFTSKMGAWRMLTHKNKPVTPLCCCWLVQDVLECIVGMREYDVPYHVRFAIDTGARQRCVSGALYLMVLASVVQGRSCLPNC